MSSIIELYHSSIQSIENAKKNGYNFYWKNIDLSDLFLNEWIEAQLNSKKYTQPTFLKLVKLKLYFWRQRLKSFTLKNNTNFEIIVFFNSYSQYKVILPVIKELIKLNVQVKVVVTKPYLLEKIKDLNLQTELILGYKFSNDEFKNNHEIVQVINYFLPKLNYLSNKFLSFLANNKVNYFLVGNDSTSEGRLLATLANQSGIPTGTIQHGSLNRSNPSYGRSIVNQFFVNGIKPKEELNFLGKNENQIFIKGWTLQKQFKENLKKEFSNLFDDEKIILVSFSGPGHSTSEKHHIACVQIIKEIQIELNCFICIKLHPKDKWSYYDGFNSQKTMILTNDDLIAKNISFHQLLSLANLVITGASTSALDALMTNTEAVSFDLMKAYQKVDFIQDGLVHHIESKESLKQMIMDTLNKPKSYLDTSQKKLMEKYYYQFYDENYNPSFEIAKTIKETIDSNNKKKNLTEK